MDWTKAPKKKIRLSKGLNLAWVDLSTLDLAVVRKLANTEPDPQGGIKAENLWFEAQIEIQRRQRHSVT